MNDPITLTPIEATYPVECGMTLDEMRQVLKAANAYGRSLEGFVKFCALEGAKHINS